MTIRRWLPALLLLAAQPVAAQNVPGLESRAKAFYEQLERGQRDRAASEFPGLERDLAAAATEIENTQDKLRDQDVESDGNLETLFESERWQQLEVQGLVVAYHLAWVRYQGAQLVGDGPKKKALLQKAVDGFSQFTDVAGVPEISSESLYGRGLAYMDMGDWGKATADLEQASSEAKTASRAKAALAEVARRKAGGKAPEAPPQPAPDDPEVLATGLAERLPKVPGDAAAEKDAATLARGLAARGGAWQGRIATMVADKLGDRSSYGLWLQAQLAVDRGRCADVAPLAAASNNVNDGGRARYRPEILFMEAGCRLNGGKPQEAADLFAEFLKEFPNSDRAREAAYYRIRALDMVRANNPAATPAFEEALASYLQRFGKTDGAAEAHWLLGDLYRTKGDCVKAATELVQVPAGPFAARAKMASLECRVNALGPKTPPAERAQLVADLDAFVKATPAKGGDEALVARAALMGALAAAGTTPPAHDTTLALLADFEKNYPSQKELLPKAVEARLAAKVALGQLADATADLDAYLAAGGSTERSKTLARLGRDLAARTERGEPADRQQALVLARKVYAALLQSGGGTADKVTLADLELKSGDGAAARKLYEEVLQTEPTSAEALRGAAKAAAAAGDVDAALAYWRRVLDASPTGATSWYEARVAQVTLLKDSNRKPEACQILKSSRGRATSTGGDQLAKRLQTMEAEVCK
ncbi:MAG TPA: tetratricopeptide repeat protein [Candidatus Binatia bacterium]|nr:tetratricopeptide repeat protein [Candidatus Binatia bacterium]